MGLAGILDDDQFVLACDLQDGIHVGGLAVEVDWTNRTEGELHGFIGLIEFVELIGFVGFIGLIEMGGAKKIIEFLGIQVEGLGVDVDEDGGGADLGNGFGGGDEGVGHRDDSITRADSGGHEGEAQGVGAGVDADAVFGVAECGEGFLEVLDIGAADEGGALEGFGDHRDGFGGD